MNLARIELIDKTAWHRIQPVSHWRDTFHCRWQTRVRKKRGEGGEREPEEEKNLFNTQTVSVTRQILRLADISLSYAISAADKRRFLSGLFFSAWLCVERRDLYRDKIFWFTAGAISVVRYFGYFKVNDLVDC